MPSEDDALAELADFLDYFEHHRQEHKIPKPNPTALPIIAPSPPSPSANKPIISPSRTIRLPVLAEVTPQEKSLINPDLDEQLGFIPSAAWSNIRTASSDLNTLMLLGEPSEAPPCLAQENQSLFEDRVERIVAQLPIPDFQERAVYRELLRKFPINSSRKAIQQLIDSGRTPQAIRQIAKIRKRCQAVFIELNRWSLYGPRYCQSSYNQTVPWNLADKLLQAGIKSRMDLFRFFRNLCDLLSTSKALEQQYTSAINLARQILPMSRPLLSYRDFATKSTVQLQLSACGIDEKWRWQNPRTYKLSRKGLPIRSELAYFVTSPSVHKLSFQPYKIAKYLPFVDLESEDVNPEYLLRLIIVESPVAYRRIKLLFPNLTTRDGSSIKWRASLAKISEKLVIRGGDIWYYRDLPRLGRLPRCPHAGANLSLDEASDFDLGTGFKLLQHLYPGNTSSDNAIQLLSIWKAPTHELPSLQAAIVRFQKNYIDKNTDQP